MKRRTFIKDTALLVAAASTSSILKANQPVPAPGQAGEDNESEAGKLITSAPMLQNYAETSVGVSFAVGALANGYVLVGEKPDLSDAKKVKCGGYRVTEISDKVSQVRLTGLKPSTKYYYRIGADRIHYGGGYDMKVLGNEEDPRIYDFTTAGKRSDAHFCVINDTHVNWATIAVLMDKIAGISPSCVIWNGDASNVEVTFDKQVKIFLDP